MGSLRCPKIPVWHGRHGPTDDRGNRIEYAYYGVDGAPVLDKTLGAARETYTYDERGSVLTRSFFGIDGKPILHRVQGVAGYTLQVRQPGQSNRGYLPRHRWEAYGA